MAGELTDAPCIGGLDQVGLGAAGAGQCQSQRSEADKPVCVLHECSPPVDRGDSVSNSLLRFRYRPCYRSDYPTARSSVNLRSELHLLTTLRARVRITCSSVQRQKPKQTLCSEAQGGPAEVRVVAHTV